MGLCPLSALKDLPPTPISLEVKLYLLSHSEEEIPCFTYRQTKESTCAGVGSLILFLPASYLGEFWFLLFLLQSNSLCFYVLHSSFQREFNSLLEKYTVLAHCSSPNAPERFSQLTLKVHIWSGTQRVN